MSGAALAAARESVRAGVAQLHEALAAGHEAQAMLTRVQALARSADPDAQTALEAALGHFARQVEAAVARGAHILAGEQVAVQAEPGAAPVLIGGVDLRIKPQPAWGDIISVAAGARADDPGLPQAAHRSLEALQQAMGRLLDSARALEAHQGFLGAAEGAAGMGAALDADGARLMALQVRQSLEALGAASIANVEPQAVLALFRT
jgi:hypothetical protein